MGEANNNRSYIHTTKKQVFSILHFYPFLKNTYTSAMRRIATRKFIRCVLAPSYYFTWIAACKFIRSVYALLNYCNEITFWFASRLVSHLTYEETPLIFCGMLWFQHFWWCLCAPWCSLHHVNQEKRYVLLPSWHA